jgi:hypothetical protein
VHVESLSDALHLDVDTGIWWPNVAGAGTIAYPADHNDACFHIEDGSFWFSHRNRCIIAACDDFRPMDSSRCRWRERLRPQGLIDQGTKPRFSNPGVTGARNAKIGRHVPTVINATMGEAAIRADSVPNVGLFDVLEHIEDDRRCVRHLHDVMRSDGLLYLTVPAFNWLRSVRTWTRALLALHDAIPCRRTRRELRRDVLNVPVPASRAALLAGACAAVSSGSRAAGGELRTRACGWKQEAG